MNIINCWKFFRCTLCTDLLPYQGLVSPLTRGTSRTIPIQTKLVGYLNLMLSYFYKLEHVLQDILLCDPPCIFLKMNYWAGLDWVSNMELWYKLLCWSDSFSWSFFTASCNWSLRLLVAANNLFNSSLISVHMWNAQHRVYLAHAQRDNWLS